MPTIDQTQPSRITTMAQLHQLGRAGRAWDFLPLAAGALAQHPADAMLRFLMSANCAQLGLRALALDLLDTLDEPARSSPDASRLRAATESLPDLRITPDQRIARARRIAEELDRRGRPIAPEAKIAFENLARSEEAHKASDGSVVFRDIGERNPSNWRHFAPYRAQADAFACAQLGALGDFPRPFVIEGADPPWLLAHTVRATAPRPNGYAPPVTLVQADPVELLSGLTQLDDDDLDALLRESRLTILTGSDAGTQFAQSLESRADFVRTGPAITIPTIRTRAAPSPATTIDAITPLDQQREQTLGAQLDARAKSRSIDWWRDRYRAALSPGAAEPLRALVCTTRFSTYIRHASEDLAGELRAMGCRVEVMIEPDDRSAHSTSGKRDIVRRFDPDLVVCINYPRDAIAESPIPPGVPFVCWVQDAMAHLFDPALGASQGPLDFFMGHVFREMVLPAPRGGLGYPPDRMLPAPVIASSAKFHDGPIDADLLRSHECEIAMATHHSETPEAMRDRLIRDSGSNPAVRTLLHELHDAAVECARDAHTKGHHKRLHDRATELLQAHTRGFDHASLTRLMRQAAEPLIDRVFRHETIAWAADLADTHGWRFHLYGAGWEASPKFARFAKPALDHGEALRASYRGARVHLHASARTMIHQRPIECLLSGGFIGCRLFRDGLAIAKQFAEEDLIAHEQGCDGAPAQIDANGWRWRLPVDAPRAMAYQTMLDRLGIPNPGLVSIKESPDRLIAPLRPSQEADIVWLLGDPAQTCFWDLASLERLVASAIERPAWRDSIIRAASARARERLTTASLARRMLDMIAQGLDASTAQSATKGAA